VEAAQLAAVPELIHYRAPLRAPILGRSRSSWRARKVPFTSTRLWRYGGGRAQAEVSTIRTEPSRVSAQDGPYLGRPLFECRAESSRPAAFDRPELSGEPEIAKQRNPLLRLPNKAAVRQPQEQVNDSGCGTEDPDRFYVCRSGMGDQLSAGLVAHSCSARATLNAVGAPGGPTSLALSARCTSRDVS
jgi:hypothetical protein